MRQTRLILVAVIAVGLAGSAQAQFGSWASGGKVDWASFLGVKTTVTNMTQTVTVVGGKVGIGTNTPVTKFHVYTATDINIITSEGNGADYVDGGFHAKANNLTRGAGYFASSATNKDTWYFGIPYNDAVRFGFCFKTGVYEVATADKAYMKASIAENGWMCIGTNIGAQAALDVHGGVIARGTSFIYYASATNYVARWATGVGEYYVQAMSNGTLSAIVTNTMTW
jgi:hypothetical protein